MHFGSDTTPGALQVLFHRRLKPGVKLLRHCAAAGDDPKALNITSVYDNMG